MEHVVNEINPRDGIAGLLQKHYKNLEYKGRF
jgi:hypothetical protein